MRFVLRAPEERPLPTVARERVVKKSSGYRAAERLERKGHPPLSGTVRLLFWMTRRSLRDFLHLSHV